MYHPRFMACHVRVRNNNGCGGENSNNQLGQNRQYSVEFADNNPRESCQLQKPPVCFTT